MSMVSSTSPAYRHIVLAVTLAIYAGYVTSTFPVSDNPGLNPTIVWLATSDQICESNQYYILLCVHYDTYHSSDKALCQFILEVIPVIYIDAIKYGTMVFHHYTALEIIYHVWDTYRIVDDDELAEHLGEM